MIDPTGRYGSRAGGHRGRSFARSIEVVVILALFSLFSACTPTSNLVPETYFPAPPAEGADGIEAGVSELEKRLRSEVAEWIGSPYARGGTTASGIDCSAFVQRVYRDALNFRLPRTTREQVHAGKAVSRRYLRPGDLVFFRPPTKVRHVGIYLNDGAFAHASTSQGVMISDLDQEYWDRSYWTSRRILADSERAALADRSQVEGIRPLPKQASHEPTRKSKRQRLGW